jgi:hypothetical protein
LIDARQFLGWSPTFAASTTAAAIVEFAAASGLLHSSALLLSSECGMGFTLNWSGRQWICAIHKLWEGGSKQDGKRGGWSSTARSVVWDFWPCLHKEVKNTEIHTSLNTVSLYLDMSLKNCLTLLVTLLIAKLFRLPISRSYRPGVPHANCYTSWGLICLMLPKLTDQNDSLLWWARSHVIFGNA